MASQDRRAPDPWRDDVDSHLRFLRAEAKQGAKDRQAFRTELDTHTHMLTKIDCTLVELTPILTSIKVARKGGKMASFITDVGAKLAKIGLFTGAALAFVLALTHGETWKHALTAFWRVVSGGE